MKPVIILRPYFLRLCRLQIHSHLRYASTSANANAAPIVGARVIDKLLIANRGEIACRIMATARRLGIRTVAVFSDADQTALHVAMADEAFNIGPAASANSYLRYDRILEAAERSDAQAIHPGYGFLSENAEFADLCAARGRIFVGPPSSAIRDMGIKNRAKQIMADAGVPVVGGYHGEQQDDDTLREQSAKIGYPVMLKAVYGGGGKGMRIAASDADFAAQLDSARREAMKSFGNDQMLVEKFIENPRHVEVQVFGDEHGNYVYLYERDCSVQRRHQKIIEEAPAPGITEETRRYLGEAAVKAARAVGYVGAGTVEFIMDAQQQIYFMEMNTRLQVEHPVTEMVTGNTDLVEWQLRVAQGEPLPICEQRLIPLRGHAFEARLYAEDPNREFMPGAGPLHHLRFPAEPLPDFLRVETGVCEGDEVSVHYDPMIAKLVAWGPDRASALRRMDAALAATHIVGLRTNIGFLRSILAHREFQLGRVYTDFIPDHYEQLFPARPAVPPFAVLAEAVGAVQLKKLAEVFRASDFDRSDPFSALNSFRVNLEHEELLQLDWLDAQTSDDAPTLLPDLTVRHLNSGGCQISCAESSEFVVVEPQADAKSGTVESTEFSVDIQGHRRRAKAVWTGGRRFTLFTQDGQFELCRRVPQWLREAEGGIAGAEGGAAIAPMPGVVEKLMVAGGDSVKHGDPLIVMVAMKMEYVIKAAKDGVIADVCCAVGDSVAKNAVLVSFVEDEASKKASNSSDDDEQP